MLIEKSLSSDLEIFFTFEDVKVVSGLFSNSCEESKNRQPSPGHTIETSDSRVSPTTVNHRYFICFIIVILFSI
jgi:hypothetical protein